MNDVAVRALKTFAQAFLGIFIPELVLFIKDVYPFDMSSFDMILIPVVCSALAAGISAVWNFVGKLLVEDSVDVLDDYVKADDFEE